MNKKGYEKPTMTVVELRHRTQLLTGSVQSKVSANRSSYGTANSEVTELNDDGEWEWN
jgi:hypothetical protein